jgi:hypothetical protein
MTRSTASRLAAVTLFAFAALGAASAQARTDVYFSVLVPVLPVYAEPAPVYRQPYPIYTPPPVYRVEPWQPAYRHEQSWRQAEWQQREWERRHWQHRQWERQDWRQRGGRDHGEGRFRSHGHDHH